MSQDWVSSDRSSQGFMQKAVGFSSTILKIIYLCTFFVASLSFFHFKWVRSKLFFLIEPFPNSLTKTILFIKLKSFLTPKFIASKDDWYLLHKRGNHLRVRKWSSLTQDCCTHELCVKCTYPYPLDHTVWRQ